VSGDDKPARRGWSDEKRATFGRSRRDTARLEPPLPPIRAPRPSTADDGDVPELSALAAEVRSHAMRLVALSGEHGTNGKVGDLRATVAQWRTTVIGVALAVLGGLAGVAWKIHDGAVASGERRGRLELRVEMLERDLGELRADRRASRRDHIDPGTSFKPTQGLSAQGGTP